MRLRQKTLKVLLLGIFKFQYPTPNTLSILNISDCGTKHTEMFAYVFQHPLNGAARLTHFLFFYIFYTHFANYQTTNIIPKSTFESCSDNHCDRSIKRNLDICRLLLVVLCWGRLTYKFNLIVLPLPNPRFKTTHGALTQNRST